MALPAFAASSPVIRAMLVTIAAVPPKLILVGLIISDSLACPTPRFREKYGAKDVKKYYAKFDAAVCLRRCDGPRDPCRSPAGTGRATTGLWQVSSSCRSYVGGKPDCLRRFGVKLKNVRAARSTSVEAFRLRSPQARLPPGKDRAGFGEGVLQSHTPTDHSLIPRTSSRYHSAADDIAQLHPQANANFG